MADAAADDTATALLARLDQLAAERAPWEPQWEDLARYVAPWRSGITDPARQPADRKPFRLYDGTAGLAMEHLAAGLWGMISNAANSWFKVRSEIEDLNQGSDVKEWCGAVTEDLTNVFAALGGAFYNRAFSLYKDAATFGTGVFFVQERGASGDIAFSVRPLSEIYLAEDQYEHVDTVFRRFRWTARQAAQRWGADALGTRLRQALDKAPDTRFAFLHAIEPNPDHDPRRADAGGMPWRSTYVSVEDRRTLSRGGYHTMPYQVMRWGADAGGPYGVGPAQLALPDVKMVNTMAKTGIVGAQMAIQPPLLAADETARGLKTSPGQVIPGGLDQAGRPLYVPLQTGARVELGLEMEDQRRQAIRDAMYFGLLMMVQSPSATATEILAKQEEKLRLLGPHLGRITAEFLDPLMDRVFDIRWRAGRLPPPPQVLQQYPDLKIDYVSPLARAQRASEAGAIVRAIESIVPLAQARPEALDLLDTDAIVRHLADGYGAPADILLSPEALQALRQQRAQQQQMAQMAQMAAMAGPLAAAAKDGTAAMQAAKELRGP